MSTAWADAVEGETVGEAPVVVSKQEPCEHGDGYFKMRQLEDEVVRLHLVVRTLELGIEKLQRASETMRALVDELHTSRDVLFRELGGETMMAKLRDERTARVKGVARQLGSVSPNTGEAEGDGAWQTVRRRGGGRKAKAGA